MTKEEVFKKLKQDTTANTNIRKLIDALPEILAVQPFLSMIAYTRYVSLVEACFDRQTALSICKEVFK
ncbi:MAG: hypothetical protein AUJ56_08010 [Zetaproteobacteria bacterium CG1_02_49_23]|nr:MAG: hypothetical protein AUJ56_08010 [Zetaproteobacteria bacterium CG1_02_49_23]